MLDLINTGRMALFMAMGGDLRFPCACIMPRVDVRKSRVQVRRDNSALQKLLALIYCV